MLFLSKDYNFHFVKQLPARLKLSSSENMDTDEAACRKRTSECKGGECDKSRLATLDVFAGCGGLSEGLQQAGNLLYYNIFHISKNNFMLAWYMLWGYILTA